MTDMALIRCEACGVPAGRTRKYVASIPPLGYPNTAAICGLAGCEKPGLIWLEGLEKDAYKKGQRVFRIPSFAMKGASRKLTSSHACIHTIPSSIHFHFRFPSFSYRARVASLGG